MRPLPLVLSNRIDSDLSECKNLGLILDKYQPWKQSRLSQGWSLQFHYQRQQARQWHDRISEKINETKGHWLACSNPPNDIRRLDPILDPNNRIEHLVYQDYFARWEELVNQKNGLLVKMKNVSRLVLGLDGKGTLEMGLTLHHHAGYPWITGSAVKGAARSWALLRLAEKWGIPSVDNEEYFRIRDHDQTTPLQKLSQLVEVPIGPDKDPHRFDKLSGILKSLKNNERVRECNGEILNFEAQDLVEIQAFMNIRKIFGGLGGSGKIIFFGGMCKTSPKFVTEVITPHFNNYYQDDNYPRDDGNPVPNVFLALEENQKFHFGVGARCPSVDNKIVKIAMGYMVSALQDLGVGAKTSSGMGVFEYIELLNK